MRRANVPWLAKHLMRFSAFFTRYCPMGAPAPPRASMGGAEKDSAWNILSFERSGVPSVIGRVADHYIKAAAVFAVEFLSRYREKAAPPRHSIARSSPRCLSALTGNKSVEAAAILAGLDSEVRGAGYGATAE